MLPPPKEEIERLKKERDASKRKASVRFTLNAFGRWIIHKEGDFSKAWSGSRFVKVSLNPYGIPLKVQVCNFETLDEARDYWEKINVIQQSSGSKEGSRKDTEETPV